MQETRAGEKIQMETLEYKPRKFRNTTAYVFSVSTIPIAYASCYYFN